MSRRRWIILVVVIVLVVGAEVAVRIWNSSKGCVQIINHGANAIDDLVASCGSTRIRIGRLVPGASTNVWFSAAKPEKLVLDFKQPGNPLKGFVVDEFNPAQNRRDGLKVVLDVQNDRVERYADEDDAKSELGSLVDRIKAWFEEAATPP
jgi:hypothetical protein